MTSIEVRYVDHMGDDLRTVDAARVSMKKRSEWIEGCALCGLEEYDIEGCTTHDACTLETILSAKDRKLIDYLGKHHHKSPFNHNALTVYVKAPIFVARQLVKHEYLPMNEVSRRYVDDEVELYVPEAWRGRADNVKQGSAGPLEDAQQAHLRSGYTTMRYAAIADYEWLLQKGVAPEQARMVLPQSLMTEWYWSGFLGAWAKMVNLRDHDDAQHETRLVAQQVDRIARELWPHSWEALRKYNVK